MLQADEFSFVQKKFLRKHSFKMHPDFYLDYEEKTFFSQTSRRIDLFNIHFSPIHIKYIERFAGVLFIIFFIFMISTFFAQISENGWNNMKAWLSVAFWGVFWGIAALRLWATRKDFLIYGNKYTGQGEIAFLNNRPNTQEFRDAINKFENELKKISNLTRQSYEEAKGAENPPFKMRN